MTNETVQVGVRMERALYERVVKHQQEAKRKTGFEPSIAEVVRVLVARGLDAGRKR